MMLLGQCRSRLILVFWAVVQLGGVLAADPLESGFLNPPQSCRVRTWWHCMSGNMSRAGITKDLESMKAAGLGGVLMFNVSVSIPKGRVKYNSREHRDLIRHAAGEAKRLGLSFGVHNCAGWSSSGGPWITPADAMKMVVWSQTVVQGGEKKQVKLPRPTVRNGFYNDVAVLAYPALSGELEDARAAPEVTTSQKGVKTDGIRDGRIDGSTRLGRGKDKPWIQFRYRKPFTVRSVYIVQKKGVGAALQTSTDGRKFSNVAKLKNVRTGKEEYAIFDSVTPVKAKYFRVVFSSYADLKEVRLSAASCIRKTFSRTLYGKGSDKGMGDIGSPPTSDVIPLKSIRNLTKEMSASGELRVDLPKGDWTIMRFGYTSTGAKNRPASAEGAGLECDKFSRAAFKKHYDAFIGRVLKEMSPEERAGFTYAEIDSYEMGGQNWTEGMEEIFKKAKGYDLIPFLPLFAGRFVDSPATSDAVLWDFRDLGCTMMTENYYGYFSELCHRDGLITYVEPYGNGPIQSLAVGGKTDIPMGEFWMNRAFIVRTAVAAARAYGKNIVSAESFTAKGDLNYKGHPAMARPAAERAWAAGVNEFMLHRFAHQANTHVVPGMTMGPYGFNFDRTQTWWLNAGAAFFEFAARGSFLLRQGRHVADVVVFIGDGSPNGSHGGSADRGNVPAGYTLDSCDTHVLMERLNPKGGLLCNPEGVEYRLLLLENSRKLRLSTLKRIAAFADAGVAVMGPKPVQPAGYLARKRDAREFKAIADRVWKLPNVSTSRNAEPILKKMKLAPDFAWSESGRTDYVHRKTGNANIYFVRYTGKESKTIRCNFRVDGRIPELWDPESGKTIELAMFTHRDGVTQASIPFNPGRGVFVVFRKSSKGVASCVIEKGLVYLDKGKPTLRVSHNGAYSCRLADGEHKVTVTGIPLPITIADPWSVEFDDHLGTRKKLKFAKLTDWKDNADDEIRHYSGTAVYRASMEIPANALGPGKRVELDLGRVEVAARVIVNGKELGVLWCKPYVIDISRVAVAGGNEVVLKVTNLWSNRLIGDAKLKRNDGYPLKRSYLSPKEKMPEWYVRNQPQPPSKRRTFCTMDFYKATSKLEPSGLIGPVQLRFYEDVVIP